MRYFTRGWTNGELSDEEFEQAMEHYRARIAAITPRLPPAVVRLAREVSLHDGLIERVVWSPHLSRLRLSIVSGDPQLFQVQLTYSGAMLGTSRIESLRRAALSRETTLIYDEVDIDADGHLSHRLLFDPSEEVTIDFRELDLVVSPRADARVYLLRPFIQEEPEESS